MTLVSGGIPMNIIFPTSLNANITNTSLPITGNVGVLGTVTTTTNPFSILLEKEYDVTTSTSQLTASDIPANCKGIIYQYLSTTATDILYVRFDGVTVTATNGGKSRPEVSVQVDTLAAVQGFRFLATTGMVKGLKIYYLG